MGCDTICDLPDALLTQILLNLETKDSVKTSVLSTRWRNLWLSVPGLDLADHFPSGQDYESFIDRFMEFNQESCLHVMRHRDAYRYHYQTRNTYNIFQLIELISAVVARGLQHLDIKIDLSNIYGSMHQNIYKSKTLVSLKLAYIGLKNPGFVVSLPCLKIMHLSHICYGKEGPLIVEKLISGCPLLEDVHLIRPFNNILKERDVLLFLRFSSQTLKRCCLGFAINKGDTDFTVEIDAPRLEYLKLTEVKFDGIVATNLSSLFTIDFYFNYYAHVLRAEDLSKRDIFCEFLTVISSVKVMIIRVRTLEVFYYCSKLGPIPKFNNLYHLQAKLITDSTFSSSSFHMLLAFLESCPNMKNLIFDFCDSKHPTQIYFTKVPRCLISTLEYVEIKKWMTKDATEIKLANYFLENSAVLKKLTLSFKELSMAKQEAESYKKLLTSTKLSPTCQVVIESLAADDEHMT